MRNRICIGLLGLAFFSGCAGRKVQSIDIPLDKASGRTDTYAYGYADVIHASDFEINLSNSATGEKKRFHKAYLITDFSPEITPLLFSFPISGGKWKIDKMDVYVQLTPPNTSPDFKELEIVPGKGNFIGKIRGGYRPTEIKYFTGKDAEINFTVDRTAAGKAEVDKLMAEASKDFHVENTVLAP